MVTFERGWKVVNPYREVPYYNVPLERYLPVNPLFLNKIFVKGKSSPFLAYWSK